MPGAPKKKPLTAEEIERGAELGRRLQRARGERTLLEVAYKAGLAEETIRKIESGKISTPGFFTIVRLSQALEIPLDVLID